MRRYALYRVPVLVANAGVRGANFIRRMDWSGSRDTRGGTLLISHMLQFGCIVGNWPKNPRELCLGFDPSLIIPKVLRGNGAIFRKSYERRSKALHHMLTNYILVCGFLPLFLMFYFQWIKMRTEGKLIVAYVVTGYPLLIYAEIHTR